MENIKKHIENLKKTLLIKKKDYKAKIQLLISSVEPEGVKNLFHIEDDDKKNPLVKFCELKSGDFWITYNGKLLFFFERKTLKDLSASLSDGRWQSQRLKMDGMPIASHRMFIWVESNYSFSDGKERSIKDPPTVSGMLLNTITNERRQVFRAQDEYETCYYILNFVRKAYEFGNDYETELLNYPTLENNFDPIKTPFTPLTNLVLNEGKKTLTQEAMEEKFAETKKRTNIDNSRSWFISNLKSISRVGNKALAVVKKWPTHLTFMTFLMEELEGVDAETAKKTKIGIIAKLKLETSNQLKKKQEQLKAKSKSRNMTVGPAAATRIYEFFME